MNGQLFPIRLKPPLALAALCAALVSFNTRPTVIERVAASASGAPVAMIGGSIESIGAIAPSADVDEEPLAGPGGGWGHYGTSMQIGAAGLTIFAAIDHPAGAVAPPVIRLSERPASILLAPADVNDRFATGHRAMTSVFVLASADAASGASATSGGLPRGLEAEDAVADVAAEAGDSGSDGAAPPAAPANPIPLPPAVLMGSIGLALAAAAKRLRAWR